MHCFSLPLQFSNTIQSFWLSGCRSLQSKVVCEQDAFLLNHLHVLEKKKIHSRTKRVCLCCFAVGATPNFNTAWDWQIQFNFQIIKKEQITTGDIVTFLSNFRSCKTSFPYPPVTMCQKQFSTRTLVDIYKNLLLTK